MKILNLVERLPRAKAMRYDGTAQSALDIGNWLGVCQAVVITGKGKEGNEVSITFAGIRDRRDPLGHMPREIIVPRDCYVVKQGRSVDDISVLSEYEFNHSWEEESK